MELKTPRMFETFALAGGLLVAMAMAPAIASANHGNCGQPASNGHRPASVDALVILKTSVAHTPCGDIDNSNDGDDDDDGVDDGSDDDGNCECDVDNSGSVTPKDALRVLRAAVGFPGRLECAEDCMPGETTTTTLGGIGQPTTTTLSGDDGDDDDGGGDIDDGDDDDGGGDIDDGGDGDDDDDDGNTTTTLAPTTTTLQGIPGVTTTTLGGIGLTTT